MPYKSKAGEIAQRDMAAANGRAPSDNCLPVRLLIGWLSDLEQWRDIRASKIDGARTAVGVHMWANPTPAAMCWRFEFSVGD